MVIYVLDLPTRAVVYTASVGESAVSSVKINLLGGLGPARPALGKQSQSRMGSSVSLKQDTCPRRPLPNSRPQEILRVGGQHVSIPIKLDSTFTSMNSGTDCDARGTLCFHSTCLELCDKSQNSSVAELTTSVGISGPWQFNLLALDRMFTSRYLPTSQEKKKKKKTHVQEIKSSPCLSEFIRRAAMQPWSTQCCAVENVLQSGRPRSGATGWRGCHSFITSPHMARGCSLGNQHTQEPSMATLSTRGGWPSPPSRRCMSWRTPRRQLDTLSLARQPTASSREGGGVTGHVDDLIGRVR